MSATGTGIDRLGRLKPWLGTIPLALAGLALWGISQRTPPVASFAISVPDPTEHAASPRAERHDLLAGTAAAHSAHMLALPGGDRLAFWFAGTREGAGDVQIFSARWHQGKWSEPRPMIGPRQVMLGSGRFVRKVGNPVAVRTDSGQIHLFFVSVSLGGWATSQINQVSSLDGGQSWGRPRMVVTSPFMNLSTLVRTSALHRTDGGFDLPVYHEGARKFPELLRFDPSGQLLQKIRLTATDDLLQPAIAALSEQHAVALLRNGGPIRRLTLQETLDGGQTWSPPAPLDIINPDAAVSIVRLANGQLLLAYNPREDGRSELALATSPDGRSWTKRKTVEQQNGGEFSYPTLVADGDTIDLVYTWQRQHIRHVRFNTAWLNDPDQGPPES